MTDEEDLRKAIRALGPNAVAKRAKVPLTTLSSWLNDSGRRMRSDNMEAVRAAVAQMRIGNALIGQSPQPDADEILYLPAYDIRAAAGDGAHMQDSEPLFMQPFRAQWLKKVTRANLSALALIEVSGDSMAGTLDSGDLILVDTSMTAFRGEGIYVLMVEEALFVKRVSLDPDSGALILVSDNTRYPAMRVTNRERTRIIGRVIWASRTLI